MLTYLTEVFEHLANNETARSRLNAFAGRTDTFENITKFERENRRSLSLSKPLFTPEL